MINIKPNIEKISHNKLNQFQNKIKSRIPDDYYNFLLNYNGGKPELNIINAEKYGQVNIRFFFGLNLKDKNCDLEENIKLYSKRLPEEFIPIGESEGGNLICLCLKSDSCGVFFWDHEYEVEEGKIPSGNNLYKISDTFTNLLSGLEKFDSSKVEVKKEDIISSWIDPDFLKEINNNQ